LVFGLLSVSLVFVLIAEGGLAILTWSGVVLEKVVQDWAWLGALALSVGSVCFAVLNARRAARVQKLEVKLESLPPEFEGYRIVQISDVHIGPGVGRSRVASIVEQCNALEADLLALTGDLADGPADELRTASEPLAGLVAQDGVVFVTGNHDYYSRVDPWCARARELGMKVLLNEHFDLQRGEARIRIGGVTDPSGGLFREGHAPELRRALGDDAPDCSILLAHQPKCAREAAGLGYALQISGHTHGGQYFPFNLLIFLTMPFVAGLYRIKGMQLFVHRGTTWWGPPMRLGSPHEVVQLTLNRA